MEYDVLVFIGKFSPFHNGHNMVVKEAKRRAKKVIIILGSSQTSLNIKIPFTFKERCEMIKAEHPEYNVVVLGCPDYPYSDSKWINKIQTLVNDNSTTNSKIGLIGHSKDESSYYLNLFPNWDSVEVKNYKNLNATNIRNMIYEKDISNVSTFVPKNAFKVLCKILHSYEFQSIFDEYDMIQKYKKSWKNAPYSPTFVTTDAVVYQSGYVLLITRKSEPGKNLLALPGGFINENEKIVDSIIRELKEETKIKVPEKVLKGNIKEIKIFDHPYRSFRGRTITHAGFIELPSGKLPKITAADDAKYAKWYKTSDIKENNMFEDHYHIIDYFTNISE